MKTPTRPTAHLDASHRIESHRMSTQPAASQAKVFAGVAFGLAIAAVPFAFKEVRAREQAVAEARDSAYDAKDEARNARLSTRRK